MTRFVLFGGKGGVGKTTIAASTAVSVARDDNKTLIISTDPAHSISDVFRDTSIGAEPTRVFDDMELYAKEVDPKERFDNKYSDTGKALLNEASKLGIDVDSEKLSGSDIIGSDEAAVIDLFAEYDESDWDFVVFDTAPTGHTLRLLQLPDVLDSVVGTVLDIKSKYDSVKGKVTGVFSSRDSNTKDIQDVDVDSTKKKLRSVSDIIRNSNKTMFFPVMEAEELSLSETKRLVSQLEENDISVGGVFINKVLEDINEDCSLCAGRKEHQEDVISEAEESLSYSISTFPLYEEPPRGNELRRIADRITVN